MLIASVVAMTSCGSSSNKPDAQASTTSASTTSASSTKEFVSKKYGFAVTLPDAYAEVDATVDWGGQYTAGPGSNQFANFPDFAAHRTVMGASAEIPAGTQLADFRAALVRGTPSECTPSSSVQNTTLGGEPALLWTVKCSDGYDGTYAAALHGDKGWVLYMPSAAANDDTEDQQIFDHARQSFRFTS
jgi:hypothetical protein